METVAGTSLGELNRVEFFASHEGLHLDYEQAQTRQAPADGKWYNLTTHFPWLGDRTRAADGAHVEYFRGIANPIGLKVGPTLTPDELTELVDVLNPDNEPGRLTLIHRFGVGRIEECLPPLVEAVRRRGQTVLWCCDPMHGNTLPTQSGVKTRDFDDILGELSAGVRDSPPAGLVARRGAFRVDRRGRHRVHRRRPRAERIGPGPSLSQRRRPASELRAGVGNGVVDRQADGEV